MTKIRFTELVLVHPFTGGKHFSKDANGEVTKWTTGYVSEAQAFVREVEGLSAFADALDALEPGRSLFAYSLPRVTCPEDGLLVLAEAKRAQDHRSSITRSELDFAFSQQPGIMALDNDPSADDKVLGPAELRDLAFEVMPRLRGVEFLQGSSSSSWIYHEDGREIVGQRGQRLYFIATDARDIPRASEVLQKRLWLVGHGRILISGSGAQLLRTPFDAAMGQASRLDYAAGAVCSGGIEQRRPAIEGFGGDTAKEAIDTRELLPDLSAAEEAEYSKVVRSALDATADEAQATRRAWAETRLVQEVLADLQRPDGMSDDDWSETQVREFEQREKAGGLERWTRAAAAEGDVILPLSTVVHLSRNKTVTLRELATEPGPDALPWCDPREPDYRGYQQTGSVYPKRRVGFSFAHGTTTRFVLGTPEEHEAIWQDRIAKARHAVQERIFAIDLDPEEALSAATIEISAVLKAAGQQDDLAKIEGEVKLHRKKTEWSKRTSAAAKRENADRQLAVQAYSKQAERFGVVRVNVQEPNAHPIPTVVEELSRRDLVFDFGGVAATIARRRSGFAKVWDRDEQGNRIDGTDRPAVYAQPLVMSRVDVLSLVKEVCHFYALDDGKENEADAPETLVSAVTSYMKRHTCLSPLNGVAVHPVVYNGEVLVGDDVYHEPTGLWLQTGSHDIPVWQDPAEAYRFLTHEWLRDFVFDTDTDRASAVMLAASLLVARTDLQHAAGPPFFLVTAGRPATGKTFLVDIIHRAVVGEPVPSSSYPEKDGDEREKILTSLVIEVANMILFDNLPTASTLGSSHRQLIKFITDAVWSGRVLGHSQTIRGPASAVVVGTGNNVTVSGEMSTRTVEIRLQAPDENLSIRNGKLRDLTAWTDANRPKILGALARVLQAEGRQEGIAGRFPAWSKLVAAPILSLAGCHDAFFDTWVEAGETDTAGQGTRNFGPLLNEIASLKVNGEPQSEAGHWWTPAELLDAIPKDIWSAANFGEDVTTPDKAASILRKNADTRSGGVRLQCTKGNLGDRTDRKERVIVRVSRRPGSKVPLSREEALKRMGEKVALLRQEKDEMGNDDE